MIFLPYLLKIPGHTDMSQSHYHRIPHWGTNMAPGNWFRSNHEDRSHCRTGRPSLSYRCILQTLGDSWEQRRCGVNIFISVSIILQVLISCLCCIQYARWLVWSCMRSVFTVPWQYVDAFSPLHGHQFHWDMFTASRIASTISMSFVWMLFSFL